MIEQKHEGVEYEDLNFRSICDSLEEKSNGLLTEIGKRIYVCLSLRVIHLNLVLGIVNLGVVLNNTL